MPDLINPSGLPKEKMYVMIFSQTIGQVNFQTLETKEEIYRSLIGDRVMAHVTGISDWGSVVDHWYDLSAEKSGDIRMLAIGKLPSGKIALPAPGPVRMPMS